MSNINLWKIYNQKLRKFGRNDSARFQNAFLEAVNNAYAEFNDQIFSVSTLTAPETFDEIIDNRLVSFTSLTFDAGANAVIGNRDFWSIEYSFERKSATNGFIHTITDSTGDIVIEIGNGVLGFTGSTLAGSVELPDIDVFKLLISSNKSGYRILIDDTEKVLDTTGSSEISLLDIPDLDYVPDLDIVPGYTLGDSSTSQPIATISSQTITGISGLELNRLRFYSAAAMLCEYNMNEDSADTITDEVGGYDISVVGGTWATVYVEPDNGLDSSFLSPFNMAVDYHLQDGGEWAIEPSIEREKKWYERGIRMARGIYQDSLTFTGPLGD